MKIREENPHLNVEWLGENIKNWKIDRAKNIFSYISRGTSPDYVESSPYKVLNQATFSKGYFNLENLRFTSKFNNSSLLKNDDILIASTGGGVLGKTYYVQNLNDNFIADSHVTILRGNNLKIHNKYYYYFFSINYSLINQLLALGSTNQTELQKKYLNDFLLYVPSLNEQQAIANYLDVKTQAIDKKVSLLEQKIETYKKLKNTIIAKAVTQGISNEKLSVNDLGFKTPSNWEKYRLKDLGKLYSGLSGKSGDDFNQDDNPNNRGFIPFTNIANNTYLKKDHLGTVAIGPGERQNKVRKGDLFFLMSSEGYGDIGKTAVLADDIDEAYLNSFCKGYRINQNKCNPYFLNYLLLSNIYRQRLIVEGKGFTRINLKMEKVTDFEIFLSPTLSDQKEIATYIDHKTTTIDAIVGNISKQIETLKQLRKTLINDVVTGKIKVLE
ncbi:restriction endonuclease subunit S [Kaistella montana]|uniref:Restriction endonuclease subunit S n=1 Tax=Kaistella montana TaxID=1849733 RepID=A0ABW5K9E4_9FLAO|nr:restriction endonuclease subunit S [Kaistella montana]MCQ4034859.1 restriction endonuclease subunit S [Kaistella montana]